MRPVFVLTSWDDADRFTPKLTNLLQNYALKATFFVPIKPVGHGRITDEEIMELSKAYEIGGHSMTHSDLTKLPLEAIRKEASESKHTLEQIIGTKVLCFCYPRGFFNDAVKREIEAAGYMAARTSKPYQIDWHKDPFALATTIQVRPQTRLSLDLFALAKISVGLVPVLLKKQKWSELGKKLFDICIERGGVFHIWGHSWEIEEQGNWKTLEDFFSYLAYRKEVIYLTVGEYVKKLLVQLF